MSGFRTRSNSFSSTQPAFDRSNTISTIYDRGMLVSTPKPSTENDETYPFSGEVFSRTTRRRVEVPYKRQVKVATKIPTVVDTKVRKIIPVKRLIEVEEQRPFEEEYTVLMDPTLPPDADPQAVSDARNNVHRATLKVPVTLKRTVMKPVKVIREIDDFAEIEVPANRVIEVDGYRIDEVEDTKVVEVEEVQRYVLQPVPLDDPTAIGEYEVGRLRGSRLFRNTGDTYRAGDPALMDVEDDDLPGVDRTYTSDSVAASAATHSSTYTKSIPTATLRSTQYGNDNLTNTYVTSYNATYNNNRPTTSGSALLRSRQYDTNNGSVNPVSFYRQHREQGVITPVPAYGQYDRTGYTDPKGIIPAGNYKRLATSGGAPRSEVQVIPRGGFSVRATHTAHTDGHGIAVSKVEFGSRSVEAGLQVGDVITHINGKAVDSVDEIVQSYASAQSGVLLRVNRDGRRGIVIRM